MPPRLSLHERALGASRTVASPPHPGAQAGPSGAGLFASPGAVSRPKPRAIPSPAVERTAAAKAYARKCDLYRLTSRFDFVRSDT